MRELREKDNGGKERMGYFSTYAAELEALQKSELEALRKAEKLRNFMQSKNEPGYHIEIARFLGSVNAAIYFSELCQRHQHHKRNNDFTNDKKHGDGWFICTTEQVKERTVLSADNQKTARKLLVSKGLIEHKNFGLPCRKYFRINEEKILSDL